MWACQRADGCRTGRKICRSSQPRPLILAPSPSRFLSERQTAAAIWFLNATFSLRGELLCWIPTLLFVFFLPTCNYKSDDTPNTAPTQPVTCEVCVWGLDSNTTPLWVSCYPHSQNNASVRVRVWVHVSWLWTQRVFWVWTLIFSSHCAWSSSLWSTEGRRRTKGMRMV